MVDEISKLSLSVKSSAEAAGHVSQTVAYNKSMTLKAKSYMDELACVIENI